MDRESPEVIEERMRQTRCALQAKLAAAEEKVTSTVRQAGASVESAAQTVKDTVDDSLGKMRDTVAAADEVRQMFDLRRHVRDYPWLAVGGAAGTGLLFALALPRGREAAPAPPRSLADLAEPGRTARPVAAVSVGATGESWLGEVLEMAKREATGFAETLIRSFSAALRDKVAAASPEMVESLLAAAPAFVPHRNGHHGDEPPPFVRNGFASSSP